MANMVAAAATAKRLIEANGRTVTIRSRGNSPLNSSQPWRGQSTPQRASVTGIGVFVPESILSDDENVKRDTQFLLFAADNDGGHALEGFDEVEDGGVKYEIVNVKVLAPGDTRVLYEFTVSA